MVQKWKWNEKWCFLHLYLFKGWKLLLRKWLSSLRTISEFSSAHLRYMSSLRYLCPFISLRWFLFSNSNWSSCRALRRGYGWLRWMKKAGLSWETFFFGWHREMEIFVLILCSTSFPAPHGQMKPIICWLWNCEIRAFKEWRILFQCHWNWVQTPLTSLLPFPSFQVPEIQFHCKFTLISALFHNHCNSRSEWAYFLCVIYDKFLLFSMLLWHLINLFLKWHCICWSSVIILSNCIHNSRLSLAYQL